MSEIDIGILVFEGPDREGLTVSGEGVVRGDIVSGLKKLVREDRREILIEALLAGYWLR